MDDSIATIGDRAEPARMRDVARELGISVSTVSRALSKPHLVSPATVERVEAMIDRLDYRLNLTARDLRTRQTGALLVVVPSFSPFFLEIFRGAEQEAMASGYTVLMAYTGRSGDREQLYLDEVLSQRADGIVLVTSADPERLGARRAAFPPMVAALDDIPGLAVPTVRIDNFAGARLATEHLIGLGHVRIAHLSGPPAQAMAAHRAEGFRAAIAAAGLDAGDCPVVAGDFTLAAGEAGMARLLTRYPRPTAIFAANDEMAVGALQAIRRDGLRIGDDISVIGFDDQRIGSLNEPPLTTVSVPKVQLGREAVRRLIAVVGGGQAVEGAVLPVHVEVRATTGPPPALPNRSSGP